eukprot:scaffold101981_cov24-Cyclotella_meneghiniana.AAC.1
MNERKNATKRQNSPWQKEFLDYRHLVALGFGCWLRREGKEEKQKIEGKTFPLPLLHCTSTSEMMDDG